MESGIRSRGALGLGTKVSGVGGASRLWLRSKCVFEHGCGAWLVKPPARRGCFELRPRICLNGTPRTIRTPRRMLNIGYRGSLEVSLTCTGALIAHKGRSWDLGIRGSSTRATEHDQSKGACDYILYRASVVRYGTRFTTVQRVRREMPRPGMQSQSWGLQLRWCDIRLEKQYISDRYRDFRTTVSPIRCTTY